jgi:hypothetical protein
MTNISETDASQAGPSQAQPGGSQAHSRGISDISFATFGVSRSSGESSHNSHYYDASRHE